MQMMDDSRLLSCQYEVGEEMGCELQRVRYRKAAKDATQDRGHPALLGPTANAATNREEQQDPKVLAYQAHCYEDWTRPIRQRQARQPDEVEKESLRHRQLPEPTSLGILSDSVIGDLARLNQIRNRLQALQSVLLVV